MVEQAIQEANTRVADMMPSPGYDPGLAVARAEGIVPCFRRFAEGELAGERVGRVGVAIFPALGEAYEREAADEARHDALIELVIRGLAVGYVFFDRAFETGGEETFLQREPEQTWDAWTTRLNTDFLEAAGAPPETLSVLRETGASTFRDWGKVAGLGRGGKLKRIGAYYAQAGGELRMVQTQPDLEIRASPWPFDRYSSG